MKKHLFRQTLVSVVLLLLISGAILSSNGKELDKYTDFSNNINKTLYVGGSGGNNYTHIQDAIDNASEGDTIYVFNGTYNENLMVLKTIRLTGESKQNTIIDGQNITSTVYIASDNVIVENFNIINGAGKNLLISVNTGGIKTDSSDNVIIRNNIFRSNFNGIYGLRSTNLNIYDNEFIDDGINFSPYNEGERPKIYPKYFLHNIENNTVNGKTLLYLKNQKDLVINSDIGQLVMANCSDIVVKNITLTNTDTAIHMTYCSHCVIEHCNIYDTGGIWTLKSDFNVFQYNNFSDNFIHGITLDYFSSYNTIRRNIISNNSNMGVIIEYYSKSNFIFCNNLFDNPFNAFIIQAHRNNWFFNYWDDWIGVKNKIIGSFFPKMIPGILIDKKNIPLINFDWFPARQPYNINIKNIE
jgi:parallel beta-helix repeat protein